jgi:hypothetical protein
MIEWWTDNWQWATGTALGVLGIVSAVIIAFWQRRTKQLDYQIVTNLPILARGAASLRGKLTVDYDGLAVGRPHLVRLRIINSGKSAITSDSYETPIKISYERSSLLDAFISQTSSLGVSASIIGGEYEEDEPVVVLLRPGLLNPREWIEIQTIGDGPPGGISVDSRFADQSRPMRRQDPFKRHYFKVALSGALAGVLISLLSDLLLLPPDPPASSRLKLLLTLVITVLLLTVMLGLVLRMRRKYDERKHE